MSTDLRRVLAERADRVELLERDEHLVRPDQIATVLAAVETNAKQRVRRRRTVLASAGGSLAVLAVVAGALVLSQPTSHPQSKAPAGSAGFGARTSAPATGSLVPIAATPAAAELSISTVPDGWTYEGYGDSSVTYLAPGAEASGPNVFVGKIALMVGERYDPASAYQLTIAGHPARMSHDEDGDLTAVDLLVPDQGSMPLEVTIYVPDSAHLDSAEVLQLANTLDIRSTEHYAVG